MEINLLSIEMRQHFKDDWKGVKSGTKAVEVSRTKNLVRQTLKDLALVAENLPEKHLAGVFTAEQVMPFIKALVDVGPLPREHPHSPTAEQQRKIKRIGQICKEILQEFSAKSQIIAPEATKTLISGALGRDTSTRLTALLIGY
jgi:hypothetical protein